MIVFDLADYIIPPKDSYQYFMASALGGYLDAVSRYFLYLAARPDNLQAQTRKRCYVELQAKNWF